MVSTVLYFCFIYFSFLFNFELCLSNTCNYGFESSFGSSVLLSENHCNLVNADSGSISYSGSIMFECINGIGYFTYYDSFDCSNTETETSMVNNTNSTEMAEVYYCCVDDACNEECEDIHITIDYYDELNCSGNLNGTIDIYAMTGNDICGPSTYNGNDVYVSVTITESKWQTKRYKTSATSCNNDNAIAATRNRVTECDSSTKTNTSANVNINNNTIHEFPYTTLPPTSMPTQNLCDSYFARVTMDFTVYDETGLGSTTNEICNYDWASTLQSIVLNSGINATGMVVSVNDDNCDSTDNGSGSESGSETESGSESSDGSESESESESVRRRQRRLLQESENSESGESTDNESGESDDSGESNEGENGNSGSSGCAEVDLTLRIRFTEATDVSVFDFEGLATSLSDELSSSVGSSLTVSYYVEDYDLSCCEEWTNTTCVDASQDFTDLSYDCEASSTNEEEDDSANGLYLGYAFGFLMIIAAFATN